VLSAAGETDSDNRQEGDILYFVGIDIGSTTTEACIIDENRQLLAKAQTNTGYALDEAAERAVQSCCEQAGCRKEDFAFCVSTGYGRDLVPFADTQFTEIACHAKGVNYYFPEARGVIDIGGQDSKAISINETGGIVDFAMNDKCAAGTGRFLEVMARIMGLEIGEMGRLSLQSTQDVKISSICTVFAESEVISLLAKKVYEPCDIMMGIHSSVVRRVNMLVQKARLTAPIAMTGGVARNAGVVAAFEKVLKTKLLIHEDPQSMGAVGAAVMAMEQYLKNRAEAEKPVKTGHYRRNKY